jgi:Uma2 family endonuclease
MPATSAEKDESPMAILSKLLTLEEFLELPEKKPALEFEDGVVTRKPVPKGKHSRLQRVLLDVFERVGGPRKLACAFPELRTTFTGRSYVPDVAVYLWERIPRDEQGEIANDFFTPPDLAVEVVSPKEGVTGLVRKCLWYVANGVRIALLVDPADRSVLVFRLGQAPAALRGDDPIDVEEVLPGFSLTADELFRSLTLD